ncbi:hypothetical protein AV929_17615 [Haloarcula sp. K1]|nr:hypothetical protein AV929_17615 [Haloarcula sp. K1]
MEVQLITILKSTVISTDYRDSDAAEDLLSNSFRKNIDLVKQLPVSEGYELSHLNDVRKTRNDLVHNPKERLAVDDLPTLKGRIKKATAGPQQLSDIIDTL